VSELQPPRLSWVHRAAPPVLVAAPVEDRARPATRGRRPWVNRTLGATMSAFTALVVIWVITSSLPAGSKTSVVGKVQRSAIVRRIDTVVPPLRTVLSSGRAAKGDGVGLFIGGEPQPSDRLPTPDRSLLEPAIAVATRSTVLVTGSSCGTTTVGAGVVIGSHLVITSAHVIAGMQDTIVRSGTGKRHVAIPILVDPRNDVAVLRVASLDAPPLLTHADLVGRGTATALIGYPRGGQLQSDVAVVLGNYSATGHDIYGPGDVRRQVYELQATILPGESGSPLIEADGSLVGLVFAASTNHDDIGYALAGSVIREALAAARALSERVPTGACVAG
jgi:S1-C subfamily serine protease